MILEGVIAEQSQPPLIVLVHLGSCMGSADMNLGKFIARDLRNDLAGWLRDISRQPNTYDAFVVAGGLDDELDGSVLGQAVTAFVRNARRSDSHLGRDEYAGELDAAPRKIVEFMEPGQKIIVTGAWVSAGGDEGCAQFVADQLAIEGHDVEIHWSAFDIDADDEDDEGEQY